MAKRTDMDKSCFNCEHGEKYVWNEDYAYCDLDIGEIIENPKAAEDCPFYAFCEESEYTNT